MTLEEFDAALHALNKTKCRDLYRSALERGEQLEQDCREANEQWEAERDRANEMELCSTTARFQRDAARAGLREIADNSLAGPNWIKGRAEEALAESEGGNRGRP